jgi:hypothetical protein
MKANDVQIGGEHYKFPIQPWDYIIANDIGYLEGTAIKYLTRWKRKNGVEDLKKARHFIDKAIETYYQQEANQVILFDKDEEEPKLAQFTQTADGSTFFSMEKVK